MFEIAGFLAGVISEAELGAQSITYQLAVVAYMVKKQCTQGVWVDEAPNAVMDK